MSQPPQAPLELNFLQGIEDADPARWNALAGSDYPFLRHEFLHALEASGCVSARSGWRPCHVIVRRRGSDDYLALAPLYLKDHSYGEYVFDWSWAEAYQQHGLAYYPKLLSAVPFTPSAGPRLCLAPEEDRSRLLTFLLEGLQERAQALNASGLHVLFPDEDASARLAHLGLQRRCGCQYQWFNHGYRDFDDFLRQLNSRKRKNLRKERQRVAQSGIRFERLEGQEIQPRHWSRFYAFYRSTYLVRGRRPYLNEDFFRRLGESMPDSLLLVLASKDGEAIGGALSFKGANTLYGRYWGCTEEYAFLHFETCYYQGIDYCIAQGLDRFDSGAQGEHKIQRGFEPVRTWSNHWLAHPGFQQAITRFLHEEEAYVCDYIERAGDYLPFRQEQRLKLED